MLPLKRNHQLLKLKLTIPRNWKGEPSATSAEPVPVLAGAVLLVWNLTRDSKQDSCLGA